MVKHSEAQMPEQRENVLLPDTVSGLKSTFENFKASVHLTCQFADQLRERLLAEGAVTESNMVQDETLRLLEKRAMYREQYEDILSETSTWAPNRRTSQASSIAGSHRSCTSQRSTESAKNAEDRLN